MMKVMVCFGDVPVVVPCGDGSCRVEELIGQAVSRYLKVTSQTGSVLVRYLKTSDGGLLDRDDRVSDVLDDREKLTAVFEEKTTPVTGARGVEEGVQGKEIRAGLERLDSGGDGMSNGSSAGSAVHSEASFEVEGSRSCRSSVISESRASEDGATCHSCGDCSCCHSCCSCSDQGAHNVRSCGRVCGGLHHPAPCARDDVTVTPLVVEGGGADVDKGGGVSQKNKEKGDFNALTRSGPRKSLNANLALNWLDAQERILYQNEMGLLRVDPVGSSDEVELNDSANEAEKCDFSTGTLVVLENSGGPLGIHVLPCLDRFGKNLGLMVNSVDSCGCVFRDGRIREGDRITRINGSCVQSCDFSRAQEIFKEAMKSLYIKLHVIYRMQTPEEGESLSSWPASPRHSSADPDKNKKSSGHHRTSSLPSVIENTQNDKPVNALVAPPGGIPAKTSAKPKFSVINNTRLIGRTFPIILTKGTDGLGFSVTTRDNVSGGDSPVYIKNILPKGSAVTDGRLRAGDRLLKVNDTDMAGMTHEAVVAVLRNVKINESVQLIVSRQKCDDDDDVDDKVDGSSAQEVSTKPNNENKKQKQDQEINAVNKTSGVELKSSRSMEFVLISDICLSDPAIQGGLGISVKGKTTILSDSSGTDQRKDVGLFIKKISSGGAAEKDGRLQIDDWLVEVNGESLQHTSNSEAMNLLREAMLKYGRKPSSVTILVGRSKQSSTSSLNSREGVEAPVRKSAPHSNRYNKRNISYQQANFDKLFSTDIPLSVQQGGGGASPGGAGEEEIELARSSRSDTNSLTDSYLDNSFGDFQSQLIFNRHAAGRRSVSEKRKGHMDAKLLTFYQHVKATRGGAVSGGALKRTVSAVSLARSREGHEEQTSETEQDDAASRALKRCSSLSSMHAALHGPEGVEMSEGQGHSQGGRKGKKRSKVTSRWNESFRVAIDKSYETGLHLVNINDEDDDGESSLSSVGQGQGQTSRGSSQNSHHSSVFMLGEKKDKGLLKSLGGLLGFGKSKREEERNSSKESGSHSVKDIEHNNRVSMMSTPEVQPSYHRRRSDNDRLTRETTWYVPADSTVLEYKRSQAGSVSSGFYSCSQQNLMAQSKTSSRSNLDEPGSWLKSKAAYNRQWEMKHHNNPYNQSNTAPLSSSSSSRVAHTQSDSDYFSSSDDCRSRRRQRDSHSVREQDGEPYTHRDTHTDTPPHFVGGISKSQTHPELNHVKTVVPHVYDTRVLQTRATNYPPDMRHEGRSTSAHSSSRKHGPAVDHTQATMLADRETGYSLNRLEPDEQSRSQVKPSTGVSRNPAFRENTAPYAQNRYMYDSHQILPGEPRPELYPPRQPHGREGAHSQMSGGTLQGDAELGYTFGSLPRHISSRNRAAATSAGYVSKGAQV